MGSGKQPNQGPAAWHRSCSFRTPRSGLLGSRAPRNAPREMAQMEQPKAHFWGRLLSYSAAVSMHSPDLYYAPALEGLKDVVPMAARRNHADRQMLASNRSSLPFALLWL
mmetsp:Transcript_4895/g.13644  ORF Transcript_4895/g.13644 Transcript_4895/m.13644 type:complete len:110 (+) Transcript_4895:947-1276(+)